MAAPRRTFVFDLDSVRANASRLVASASETTGQAKRRRGSQQVPFVITVNPTLGPRHSSYTSHSHAGSEAIIGEVSPAMMGSLAENIASQKPISLRAAVAEDLDLAVPKQTKTKSPRRKKRRKR